MSKKTISWLIILVVVLFFFFANKKNDNNLANPAPAPTQAPPVAPKTIKYDRNTDLKQELEQVDPQVLDSDFE